MCLLSTINQQQNPSTRHPKANMYPTTTTNDTSHEDCQHEPVLTDSRVHDKQWSLFERIKGLQGSWQEQAEEALADENEVAATKHSAASISNAYASLAGLAKPDTSLVDCWSHLSRLNTVEESIQRNRAASTLPPEILDELEMDKSQALFSMYAAACAARNKPITENPNTLKDSQVFAAAVTHVSNLTLGCFHHC